MTAEEAGQVILENKPFENCSMCQGFGYVEKPDIQVGDTMTIKPNDGKYIAMRHCVSCAGSGLQYSPGYAEACRRLGIEYPDPVAEARRRWGDGDMFERQSAGTLVRIEDRTLHIRTKIGGGSSTFVVPRKMP